MLKGFFKNNQDTSYFDDKEFLINDVKLNRTLVDLAVLPILGLTVGAACSIFFKNKKFIAFFGFGTGLGYAVHYNFKPLLLQCPCIYQTLLQQEQNSNLNNTSIKSDKSVV